MNTMEDITVNILRKRWTYAAFLDFSKQLSHKMQPRKPYDFMWGKVYVEEAVPIRYWLAWRNAEPSVEFQLKPDESLEAGWDAVIYTNPETYLQITLVGPNWTDEKGAVRHGESFRAMLKTLREIRIRRFLGEAESGLQLAPHRTMIVVWHERKSSQHSRPV